jgi:hypothetical protein
MPWVRLSFHGDFGGSKGNDPIRSHLQRRFRDVDVSSGYLELLSARDPRCSPNEYRKQWRVHTSEGVIRSDPLGGTERQTVLCFNENHSDPDDKKMPNIMGNSCRTLPFHHKHHLSQRARDPSQSNGQKYDLIYRTGQNVPKAGVPEAARVPTSN